MQKLYDVKITVMKISVYEDLMNKYENPISHACMLKVGDSVIAKEGKKPKGFCDSAWTSISPFVKQLSEGKGNFYDGWMKNPNSAMISCNDGFRPVSFYLERVEKEIDWDEVDKESRRCLDICIEMDKIDQREK